MFKKEEVEEQDINEEIGTAINSGEDGSYEGVDNSNNHGIVDPHAEMEHHEAMKEFEKKRSKHHGHTFDLIKHILVIGFIAVLIFLMIQYGSVFMNEFTASTTTTSIATTSTTTISTSSSTSSTTTTTLRLDMVTINNASVNGSMFFYIEIDKFNIKEIPTALNFGVFTVPYNDVCSKGVALYKKVKLRFIGDDKSSVFFPIQDDYCVSGQIYVEVI